MRTNTCTMIFLMMLNMLTVSTGPVLAEHCPDIMRGAGLSEDFAAQVAHRIHSLTLEDLRYYFEPDATANNRVPTVNFNLTSPERVLPNAPLYGYDTSFSTIALRHLDMVLRRMDQENWGLTGYNTLELITHSFHMADMWHMIKPIYRKLKEQPPESSVCACLTDIENNGILESLHLLALQIKYPGITSGDYEKSGRPRKRSTGGVYREATGIGKRDVDTEVEFIVNDNPLKKFNFTGNEDEVVSRASEQLVNGQEAFTPRIVNEEGWAAWRDDLKQMDDTGRHEAAMFLYCVLNEN